MNVWTGYRDRVCKESARLSRDVGCARWQRGVDRWSKAAQYCEVRIRLEADRTNIVTILWSGSRYGDRTPTASDNQKVGLSAGSWQYCGRAKNAFVKESKLSRSTDYIKRIESTNGRSFLEKECTIL